MTRAKPHEHCPLCNSDRTEIRHDRSRRLRYLKKDWILEGLEHTACLECGASFNAPGQIARNNARFMEFEKATVKGIAPREIAALREKYMISQEDAARIFHTGKTAFSKWERGEVAPTGPTAVLLRLAMNNAEVMRQLAGEANVAVTLLESHTTAPVTTTVSISNKKAERVPTFVIEQPRIMISGKQHVSEFKLAGSSMAVDLLDNDFGQLTERLSIGAFVEREAEMTERLRCGHRARRSTL